MNSSRPGAGSRWANRVNALSAAASTRRVDPGRMPVKKERALILFAMVTAACRGEPSREVLAASTSIVPLSRPVTPASTCS